MERYIFEAIMLICFGVSWPVSILKAIRTKFVRGKSRLFMCFVIVGYIAGIFHKFLNPDPTTGHTSLVVWLYVFNLVMVAADLLLYLRYRNNTETISPAPAQG